MGKNIIAFVIAKYCLEAVLAWMAWMESSPQAISERQKNSFDVYRTHCVTALLFLTPENKTPLEKEIFCSVALVVDKSAEDEEWAETTKYWGIEIRSDVIRFSSHLNLATMIGAGQTPVFDCTTQEISDENLLELERWKNEFEAALSYDEVVVSLSEK